MNSLKDDVVMEREDIKDSNMLSLLNQIDEIRKCPGIDVFTDYTAGIIYAFNNLKMCYQEKS